MPTLAIGIMALGIGANTAVFSASLAARLLTTMLFDVQPVDAQVYLGVVALLGAVALAAGYLPAWRAASIDPVAILKAD